MTNLGVAVEHLEKQTLIKPKVSLSCKKCTYKTNYLSRKWQEGDCTITGIRTSNPKEVVTDGMVGGAMHMNHEKNAPDPTDDVVFEYVPDTNSADDSESGSCMEVHSDKEWVRDYEKMS